MATKKGIFLWRSTQWTWLQDIIRQCGVACSRSISWVQSRPVELVEVTWKFLLQLFLHLVPKVFYGVSASLSCRSTLNFQRMIQLFQIASSNTAFLEIPISNHRRHFAFLSTVSLNHRHTYTQRQSSQIQQRTQRWNENFQLRQVPCYATWLKRG